MNTHKTEAATNDLSRRSWLKASLATAAASSILAGLEVVRVAHAAGNELIRIGFVGCGNRGTGACQEALSTKGPVKLVAMGDLFADRLEISLENLLKVRRTEPRSTCRRSGGSPASTPTRR